MLINPDAWATDCFSWREDNLECGAAAMGCSPYGMGGLTGLSYRREHEISIRLLTMLHPLQISCVAANWRRLVVETLIEIQEIDLVHFLFATDVEFCEDMASKYSMDFTADRKERVAFFRKRPHLRLSKPDGTR
jgi:argininosuccinate lyase